MFFFEKVPWYCVVMWVVVVGGLMLVNEITRRHKKLAFFFYLVLPIVLPFTVWRVTAGPGTPVGYWFPWVKTYSALAGVLGFMYLRYKKGAALNKKLLWFPPLILSFNILEAVLRDFQCYSLYGMVDGIFIYGGPWNILNGLAGILNILAISGWVGIYITKDKNQDMIWPDQIWMWIIAYDIWNMAYVYNCMTDHAFYTGAALLVSCTLPAFFIKKGAWLQHRAQTLALWAMFSLTLPNFADYSTFAVKASHNPAPLMVLSLLAFLANSGLCIYHFSRIVKYKRNPLKEEIYVELEAYREVADH